MLQSFCKLILNAKTPGIKSAIKPNDVPFKIPNPNEFKMHVPKLIIKSNVNDLIQLVKRAPFTENDIKKTLLLIDILDATELNKLVIPAYVYL